MKYLKILENFTTRIALSGAVLCLLGLVVMTSYQVVSRFTVGDQVVWAEPAARGFQIWMVALGLAAAIRAGAMISVDVLFEILPVKSRNVLAIFVALACLLCIGLLGYYGQTLAQLFQHQKIAGMGISISWIYAAFPIGSVLAVPAVLNWLVTVLTEGYQTSEGVTE